MAACLPRRFSVPVRSFGFMRRTSSVPPPGCFSAATVLAQGPGRENQDRVISDNDKDLSSHTPQLRANSERAPLNSPSVSGHRPPAALRVSPGLLLSSFGAMLLLSSSFVALCVLICPGPSLRCCASLLLRRRPSVSLCVEAAVVCVAGGRRHEGTKFAARTAIPPRCCGYRATVDFCCLCC